MSKVLYTSCYSDRLTRRRASSAQLRCCCFFVILWPEEKCMTQPVLAQTTDWLVGLSSAAQLPQRQLRWVCLALFPPTLCKCLATVPLIILSSVSLTSGGGKNNTAVSQVPPEWLESGDSGETIDFFLRPPWGWRLCCFCGKTLKAKYFYQF